jgi:hypothetical protein
MNASALLSAWEKASVQVPALRAATLLSAFDGVDAATLDIGRREHEALRLCARVAGSVLDAQAFCAQCGERMDIALPVEAFDAAPDTCDEIESAGWRIGLRVPHTLDVQHALACADSDAALFARCVRFARYEGREAAAHDIPDALRERCEAQLERLAPLASAVLAVQCPACGHAAPVAFDAGAFAVERIGHWAEDELDSVVRLCSVFAWSEAQVLTMSPWRRQFYLDRAEAR